jgi:hypothetical protein
MLEAGNLKIRTAGDTVGDTKGICNEYSGRIEADMGTPLRFHN